MKKFLSLFLCVLTGMLSISSVFLSGCTKKSISILAIGSSYLRNSMDQVYPILESLGYDDITLGNIYSSGCKIEKHIDNISKDKGAYEYRTIVDGVLTPKEVVIDGVSEYESYKMSDALNEREWDYVIINQGATDGGLKDSYKLLPDYLSYVKEQCPSAKILFNMGWTFSNQSTLPEFINYYQGSEDVMYSAIIDAVTAKVKPLEFYKIIPAATVMRNARTSTLSESRLTYDAEGYGHATQDFGRYMMGLSLVWCVTGEDTTDIDYKPDTVTDAERAIAVECVRNAINKPFECTPYSINQ